MTLEGVIYQKVGYGTLSNHNNIGDAAPSNDTKNGLLGND